MSARKKIHTTASERLSTRNNKKLSQTRREIAAEAARIMVTQTQFNFRIAKQKAAERLGISTRVALPSNVEVEAALRAYQGFYGGIQHLQHIQKMREIALRVRHRSARWTVARKNERHYPQWNACWRVFKPVCPVTLCAVNLSGISPAGTAAHPARYIPVSDDR